MAHKSVISIRLFGEYYYYLTRVIFPGKHTPTMVFSILSFTYTFHYHVSNDDFPVKPGQSSKSKMLKRCLTTYFKGTYVPPVNFVSSSKCTSIILMLLFFTALQHPCSSMITTLSSHLIAYSLQ